MATNASIGYGTQYAIWDTTLTTPAFVTLGEVIDVSPGEESTDRIDATHYGSPDRRREYIPGLIESGEGSFTINWVPGSATDLLLRRLNTDKSVVQHKITFPSGITLTYNAYIGGVSKSVPIDDRMTAVVSVVVSGAETWGTTQ